ncbi:MAG: acyl-CoA dehydrogenase family protein [Pseudodonghicola sp.]
MDFELSEEQSMLRDSVLRFVQDSYDFAERQRLTAAPLGYSADHWRHFADMGWLALPLAEANGGLGGTAVDVTVLTGALGRGLVLEPFLPSVLLGGRLVEALGDAAQKARLLPGLAAGEVRLALAFAEPSSRYELQHVATQAVAAEDGWRLSGQKSVVLQAASADLLLVVARSAGAVGEAEGISVFLVAPEAAGLRRQDYRLADGQPASDLWLDQVPAELLGAVPGPVLATALPALREVLDHALCAICGEAVGIMGAVLELTRDYVRTRNQFGRAIGDNQVIQHRLADMFGATEEARALTDLTAMRLAEGDPRASALVAAMAAKVLACARFVGEQGIQLHGGIGMTDAYPVGHYYKRLLTLEGVFGSAAHHLGRYAARM